MADCRLVVTKAFRKTGDLEQTETPEGIAEDAGMASLQSLYDTWLYDGTFGRFDDRLIDESCEAVEWGRYTASTPVTVTLPASVSAGGRIRPVSDGAMVVLAMAEPQEVWRYNSRKGDWVALHELALESEDPLAHLGLDGLAAALALHIASDTGRELTQAVVMQAQSFRSALSQRPGQRRDPAGCRGGVLRLSRQALGNRGGRR